MKDFTLLTSVRCSEQMKRSTVQAQCACRYHRYTKARLRKREQNLPFLSFLWRTTGINLLDPTKEAATGEGDMPFRPRKPPKQNLPSRTKHLPKRIQKNRFDLPKQVQHSAPKNSTLKTEVTCKRQVPTFLFLSFLVVLCSKGFFDSKTSPLGLSGSGSGSGGFV